MSLESVNLNLLRIFLRVFEARSMTQAALSLHLTQSGVSQHIQSLEADLGVQLFERVKKRLYPTPSAEKIYAEVRKSMHGIGAVFDALKTKDHEPEGLVRIGLPVEYG